MEFNDTPKNPDVSANYKAKVDGGKAESAIKLGHKHVTEEDDMEESDINIDTVRGNEPEERQVEVAINDPQEKEDDVIIDDQESPVKVDVDEVDAENEDGRFTMLKRQVETKLKLMSQNTSADQIVAFSKLISLASPKEKAIMYVGWVFAFITGIGLPLFAQFLSSIFNSFDDANDPKKMLSQVQTIFFIMVGMGVLIGLTGFIYWWILL